MGKKKKLSLELTEKELLHLCLIFSITLGSETSVDDPKPITSLVSSAIKQTKLDESVYKKIYKLAGDSGLDPEEVADYSLIVQTPGVLIAKLGAEEDDTKED